MHVNQLDEQPVVDRWTKMKSKKTWQSISADGQDDRQIEVSNERIEPVNLLKYDL